jgi:hypothetical protein
VTLELFLSVCGFLALLVAGAWGLGKVLVRQFDQKLDERFKAQEKLRQEARIEHQRRFEKLESFQTEVYRDYIRRDDYVRDIASIKVMVENLALNVDRKLTEIWQAMRNKG